MSYLALTASHHTILRIRNILHRFGCGAISTTLRFDIYLTASQLGSPLAYNDTGALIPSSNLALPGAFYCLILLNAPGNPNNISSQLSL